MSKNDKTNVMRILDKAGIPYQIHTYDHSDGLIDGISITKKMGQDPKRVFKTLVTRGASRDYFVFVLPVERELNLKAAAKAVGEKSVEMIPVADINKVTGYIRGGCSPIGMKKQFVTVLDASCLKLDQILFSAGKIGFQVEMNPRALADFIHAGIEEISVPMQES